MFLVVTGSICGRKHFKKRPLTKLIVTYSFPEYHENSTSCSVTLLADTTGLTTLPLLCGGIYKYNIT